MRLPNVIFGENHNDFVNNDILIKLSVEFKKLGYSTVGLEEPATELTLPELIALREKQTLEYEAKLQEFNAILADFPLQNDMSFDNNLKQFIEFQILNESLRIMCKSMRERTRLYSALAAEDYKYIFLDDSQGVEGVIKKWENAMKDELVNENLEPTAAKDEIFNNEFEDMRNTQMAKHLQNQNAPYFAVLGRAHIKPIQEIMIKSSSKEVMKNNTLFLQIDSLEVDDETQKEGEPPIKPYCFKATTETEDEIVKEIVALVKIKIAAMQLYSNASALPFYAAPRSNSDLKITSSSPSEHTYRPEL